MIKTNKISLRSQESQELLKSQLVTQKSIETRGISKYTEIPKTKKYTVHI